MREQRPSQTASMVATMRALADRGLTTANGFSDPAARQLLPPGWARISDWLERRLTRAPEARRRRVMHQIDLLPLRTLAIDAEVVAALDRGCTQLVILGAGLDARAYRMPALAKTSVFEVDHPATQLYKRRKSAALTTVCSALIYVGVNFERDSLSEQLEAAGHDASAPTVWIWEGVTMYLTDAALRSTLAAISRRSAAGSTLVAQYGEPGRRGRTRIVMTVLLRFWSEPHIGARSRETMGSEIERVGLRVVSDSGVGDWARRFGADPPGREISLTRAAVAVKD